MNYNNTDFDGENIVLISIRKGIAGVEHLPPGVRVVVRSYDIDGVEDDMLDFDEQADLCVISEYEGAVCQ
jgi:hypothetical protein